MFLSFESDLFNSNSALRLFQPDILFHLLFSCYFQGLKGENFWGIRLSLYGYNNKLIAHIYLGNRRSAIINRGGGKKEVATNDYLG